MPYILALDQGTTSSRAIVFDHDGAIVAVGQREFQQIFPQPGLGRARSAARSGRRRSPSPPRRSGARSSRPRDIAAIGITNQRETTVVWDRETGEPVYNAIVWQDRRTADFCDRLKRGRARRRSSASAPASSSTRTSPAPSSRGSSTTSPARARRAEAGELAFGTVDSWLVWKLTSGATHVTDVTQRLAHAAVQHPHAASGTTSC